MKQPLLNAPRTFKGGIHPPDFKSFTEGNSIQMYMDPKMDLVFPMVQHIGAPCKPTVKKGDLVLRGQVIGEAQGYVSVPIHSSVSGKVKDVKPMLHTNGSKVLSVIIENDHQYNEVEGMHKAHDYKNMTKAEILDVIKNAGIVGMGGAGFPAHVKLNPPPDKKIDTIIVNGAECEPFLSSDFRLLIEEPKKVVEGLRIILHMFPEAEGFIAIEDNKPTALSLMSLLTTGEERIHVATLKTKYPQGGEKQLIEAITGREVPSGGLPADAGCIVHNADTVVAIYRAMIEGRPLMRRIVTIAGGAVAKACTFKVRIGTNVQELVEAAGGVVGTPSKIICGGPMMGMAQVSLDIPVLKGTSGILLFNEEQDFMGDETACIRCGKCVGACPIHLMPLMLNRFALDRDWASFEKYHGMDCIECGSCAYVCPAKRHLTQTFKAGKKIIADERRKKAAAAKAAADAKAAAEAKAAEAVPAPAKAEDKAGAAPAGK
ncbi:MAG: electron transport complex subunit RsxC [Firmicutes bacterium]|nr:electron transport complex subunit RsxC [Bacillota bacterium]